MHDHAINWELTSTPSDVQILVILVFDQEFRNIGRSKSRSTTLRFLRFLPSPEACKMAKKNIGCTVAAIRTWVALLENCVGKQLDSKVMLIERKMKHI
jgi:hypothetical protein